MYKILLSNEGSGEVLYLENPEELITFANEEMRKSSEKQNQKDDEKLNNNQCDEDAGELVRELILDPDDRSVFNGETVTHLPPKDYDVLDYLVSNKGHLVTRKELYEQLWQAQGYMDEHAVTVCIHRLRNKIEPNSKKPIFIRNVWGTGYRYL